MTKYLKMILLSACCIFASPAMAQENTTGNKTAEFPGGLEAIQRYLAKEIKYPKEAIKENLEGTVKIKFVVDTNGKIKEVIVVKPCWPALDSEAVRAVRIMPAWIPGEQNGKKIKMQFSLPVVFKLENSEKLKRIEKAGRITGALLTIPVTIGTVLLFRRLF